MTAKLRRFHRLVRYLRDCDGTAMVETALILPMLMVLTVGSIEVGNHLVGVYKLQKTAATIADVASRTPQMTVAEYRDLMRAPDLMMHPYPFMARGSVIMTSVSADGRGRWTTNWQCREGSLSASSGVGSSAIPGNLEPRDGLTIIVVETVWRAEAMTMPQNIGDRVVRRHAVFRPRLGGGDGSPGC